MDRKVFVNRILNMKKIKYIGLDMDHTLIRYHTKNFESLVYQLVVSKLITEKQYPEGIRTLSFVFNEAIRGLIIDSKNGNILKLSRYGAIRYSYHGTKPIDHAEQKRFYRSIYVDLKNSNYMAIDTSFSIAFCVLFAQLVDYKDESPDVLPSYADIAKDVLGMVDAVHADGSLKNIIRANLDHYVIKDKAVVEGLQRYIRYGKRFFILTNSDFFYTKVLLDYAITPFLSDGEEWRDLFQYVITLANKPKFFYDPSSKFLVINPTDGSMTNSHGPIVPGIYQGGSARSFTDDLGSSGDEILYIGDHIYGDIVRLKKDCNWRTALVVEELGEEIASQKTAAPIDRKIKRAMRAKMYLEHDYLDLCTQKIDQGQTVEHDLLMEYQEKIASIDVKLTHLLAEEQKIYNPTWGRVFRTGAEESYFANQVDRFACIYMEKLADLLQHSPLTYFRANRRLLAHDFVDEL